MSDAGSGAQLTGRTDQSFQVDMPSFRMTWSSGGIQQQEAPEDRTKSRADRRRRDRRSYAIGKLENLHEPGTQRQFFGASAKTAFFELYSEQAQIWAHEGTPGGEELRQASARTHYLSSCVRTQSTPIPLLINSRQERPGKIIDLSGFHMGDKAAAAWAGALSRMLAQGVELTELRLKENSLSEDGVVAISAALEGCKTLRVLDLSLNDLSEKRAADGSWTGPAEELRHMLLKLPVDQLQVLELSRCKLGDRSAKEVCRGLLGSVALHRLDLSWNGLGMGSVEGQRGQGSASAIAELLEARACPLASICLSYNQLLSRHAGRISTAFKNNKHLTELDLSWNGLGNDGVMFLADALRGNRGLTSLDLTHVEMQERGAMVIADVLKENKVLAKIILNENPIGQRGGRAVLRAMRKLVQYVLDPVCSVYTCRRLIDPVCSVHTCRRLIDLSLSLVAGTGERRTFICSAATTRYRTTPSSSSIRNLRAGNTSSIWKIHTIAWLHGNSSTLPGPKRARIGRTRPWIEGRLNSMSLILARCGRETTGLCRCLGSYVLPTKRRRG